MTWENVHYDSCPLGHASIKTTAGYTHLTEAARAPLKAILDKLMSGL
jgi:site-specific recombinase XerD